MLPSDFPWFVHNALLPISESHSTCSCYDSLGFSLLWHSLRFPLVLMTLTGWTTTQVVLNVPHWDFLRVILMVRLSLGEGRAERSASFLHHSIKGIHYQHDWSLLMLSLVTWHGQCWASPLQLPFILLPTHGPQPGRSSCNLHLRRARFLHLLAGRMSTQLIWNSAQEIFLFSIY